MTWRSCWRERAGSSSPASRCGRRGCATASASCRSRSPECQVPCQVTGNLRLCALAIESRGRPCSEGRSSGSRSRSRPSWPPRPWRRRRERGHRDADRRRGHVPRRRAGSGRMARDQAGELERDARPRPRLQHVAGGAARLVPQQGYAIGGIQRTQNETAYELKKYVDDLVATRQKLIDAGAGRADADARLRRVAGRVRRADGGRSTGPTSSRARVGVRRRRLGRDRGVARQVRRRLGAEEARRPGGAARGLRAAGHPGRERPTARGTSRTSRSSSSSRRRARPTPAWRGSCSRRRSSRRPAGRRARSSRRRPTT